MALTVGEIGVAMRLSAGDGTDIPQAQQNIIGPSPQGVAEAHTSNCLAPNAPEADSRTRLRYQPRQRISTTSRLSRTSGFIRQCVRKQRCR